MEFRILGPLEVLRDGESILLGAAQQRALLAVLVLQRGDAVSLDRLIDELWGEHAPTSAAKTVQVYVSRLRKALGPGVIETQGRSYRLAIAPEEVDVAQFESLCAEGRRALTDDDPSRATERLGSALALWRGEPLADFAYESFAQDAIARLREARLAALEDRIEADLALGSGGELIGEIESLIASNPLQERLRAQLMLALYRAGRQADALAVYRRTSELLRDELGLEPSRRLQALERSILEHDGSLDGRHAPPGVVDVCPFKGLAFFDRADAEFFYGRDGLVSEVLARAVESPLVGILGPSGIGKSSLLRAGVLPALSAGALPGSAGWTHVLLRPGPRPVAELSRALAGDRLEQASAGDRLEQALGSLGRDQRLVIAVDQLEELFTLCEQEDERVGFLKRLAAAARDPERRALIVVSLRADFYGRLASYPGFAALLTHSHVLVGPMARDDLASAITRPASRARLELEAGLTDALIADVGGEPGGLPLLSTMLLELWRARDGRVLTYDSYRSSGGVHGAVARLAEDAYNRMGDGERRIARNLLLRLAGGEDGALARRRVPLSELERVSGASPVLTDLTDARLLTVSDGEVELSHDALLREWPRYQAWLEEDRIGRRLHAHLTRAARDWESRDRDAADLYRGARLAAALEWRGDREQELNETERAFLDTSRTAAGRAQRRLRTVLAALGALLVVAIAAAVIALGQRSSARNEARVAEANRLGVQALTEQSLDRSLLLARQGVALDDSPATRGYLFDALLRNPAAIRVMHGAGNPLTALDVSPDGGTLAAGDSHGNVLFFDSATGRSAGRPYTAPTGAISMVRFSPDGTRLAVADNEFVDILDARTHRQSRRLFASPPSASGVAYVVGTIAFSPDSQVLAADAVRNGAQPSTFIARWDVASGRRLGHPLLLARTASAPVVGFTAGGELVTSSEADHTTVIRDAVSLRPVRRLPGAGPHSAVSPDGRFVALGGADGTVRVTDVDSGTARVAPFRLVGSVTTMRFTAESRALLTAGGNGRVITWNLADPQPTETFAGHAGSVSEIAISPDGRTAYTAGDDGTVISWDLAGNRRLDLPFTAPALGAIVVAPGERGTSPIDFAPAGISVPLAGLAVAATPDGGSFAVPDGAGYVDVFDSRTLRRTRRVPVSPGTQVSAVALSPDGHTMAATTTNGQLRFADLHGSLAPLQRAYRGSPMAWSLAFSGDGRWLATAGDPDPSLRVWDVRRRTIVGTSVLSPYGRVGPATAEDVTISPDGRTLAAAVSDAFGGTGIDILSLPGLRQLRTIRAPAGKAVEFSRDGRLLAFGDAQGRLWLYDTRTWAPRRRPIVAHSAAVDTVSFSPNGMTLATASDDGTARLWDVASGRAIGTALPGPAQSKTAAAFVGGGNRLVTLTDDGHGASWDIEPQSWARRACQIAGRTLTRTEWTDALPERSYAPACAMP